MPSPRSPSAQERAYCMARSYDSREGCHGKAGEERVITLVNLFERFRHAHRRALIAISTRSLHVRRCVWLRGHARRIPGRGCRGVLLRPKTPIGGNGWSRAEDPWLPVHHAGKPRLGAPRWWETGGRLSPGDGCQGWLSVSGARQGWAVCPASQDASGADEREGAGRPGSRRGGGAP